MTCTSAPARSCPSRPTTRPAIACMRSGARFPRQRPLPLNRVRVAGGRIVASARRRCGFWKRRPADDGTISPFAGETDLFITPGYRFKAVDLLMTNFHLPRSTLFMLVAAFSGLDTMQRAYAHAIASGYRFYSYGDACLLYPTPGCTMTGPFSFTLIEDRCRRAPRRDRHAARQDPHTRLHAGRNRSHRQGRLHRPARGRRRGCHSRQHLSPDAAPRRRARRPARRAAPLHALGQADPHRQRRLPGHEPLQAAQDHRRRRHLPVAYRRLDARADAGARDRDPVPARRRHPDATRRVRGAAGLAQARRARPSSDRSPGPSAASWLSRSIASGRAGRGRRCSASCRAAPMRS